VAYQVYRKIGASRCATNRFDHRIGLHRGAIHSPLGHQSRALGELRTSLVGTLDRVRKMVRQGALGKLTRVNGRLCRAHPETAAETMNGYPFAVGIHLDALAAAVHAESRPPRP